MRSTFRVHPRLIVSAVVALAAIGCIGSEAQEARARSVAPQQPTRASGLNVYAATGVGMEAAAAKAALPRVYAPNTIDNTVSVIDPTTGTVIQTIKTGSYPEHVVVSYDLKSLWIASTQGNTLTRIDPVTGAVDAPIPVIDPYNVYFAPDGRQMIIVTERFKRIDILDAQTFKVTKSIPLKCSGANHLDYTADGKFAVMSCEFSSQVFRIDMSTLTVTGYLTLHSPNAPKGATGMKYSMPQDVRLTPDGSAFLVADMMADGLFVISSDSLKQIDFIPTGKGAHGIAVGRGGSPFYIANRGWHSTQGGRHGPGTISVLDPIARKVTATWVVPGGGSPDMGNVNADGSAVWFSGRYDDEAYAFNTATGELSARIKVGRGPHGLVVWPLPGRFSFGHTGNMR